MFVDRRVVLNVISILTLKKLGKNKSNLISTNMKMTNFIGDKMTVIGILVVDIIIRLKTFSFTFFVTDAKPFYFILLDKY